MGTPGAATEREARVVTLAKEPQPYLRVILRQPANVLEGREMVVLNDGIEVVRNGEVLADLSNYVRRVEVLDGVGEPRVFRVEFYAGEVQAEIEEPRS